MDKKQEIMLKFQEIAALLEEGEYKGVLVAGYFSAAGDTDGVVLSGNGAHCLVAAANIVDKMSISLKANPKEVVKAIKEIVTDARRERRKAKPGETLFERIEF